MPSTRQSRSPFQAHGSFFVAALGVFFAAAGCPSTEPKEPPPKVARSVDTKQIPVPNHSPAQMSSPGKPRRVNAAGSMEAVVKGKTQVFTRLPRGLNAAAYSEETKVAWLKLRGALDESGDPHLEIAVENFRVDTAKYPVTLTAGEAKDGDPQLRMTYRIDASHWWKSDPAAPEAKDTKLVLDSFDGKRITGTFEGTLQPGIAGSGSPLPLEGGKFDIELRVKGIKTQ